MDNAYQVALPPTCRMSFTVLTTDSLPYEGPSTSPVSIPLTSIVQARAPDIPQGILDAQTIQSPGELLDSVEINQVHKINGM